ncbi:folylpolyglutamate synthase/dihydrofolate synthase family protein [Porphyromonas sp.]|uniref:bifunctional folylpolyglutamate synthase/dihydrofolate synthase n=1 Tax=Porphyromonas sp. TaxID=1924944 RepID=UPI0026DB4E7C|nr:folylpolyglutamate synthase/dihydrofolate synthase family protein [Porphyromonas sp.]MDO4771129.1 folylpolyglutamate synthase/dihydrofolate synthase family protein [Porphyromonas sp.]
MTKYEATIDYLFNSLPVFQHQGGSAYKPGLERVEQLLSLCDNPHKKLKTIHIAGTNGKGSTSHMLASILQSAGLRVGLFTSPHLIDFRERIRIDGEMITEDFVIDFVDDIRPRIPPGLNPSFFELTTAMAFSYFAGQGVDVAVIEVGMGGRLDSTNVLSPLLSVITNVSIDHAAYLGGTLEAIAMEKAGIIKAGTPVVLGRSKEREVYEVVHKTAETLSAPLTVADRSGEITEVYQHEDGTQSFETKHFGKVHQPLGGLYQVENTATVLCACLRLIESGFDLSPEAVRRGIEEVAKTGLRGRLQVVREASPRIVLDTGHNPGAWVYLSEQLRKWADNAPLLCVLGMAGDKDVSEVLSLLPRDNTHYICCKAKGERSMPAEKLCDTMKGEGFTDCDVISDIADAYDVAVARCRDKGIPTLFIGGSNFVIGELLSVRQF